MCHYLHVFQLSLLFYYTDLRSCFGINNVLNFAREHYHGPTFTCRSGTSIHLGGQWRADFRGQHTLYMNHDVSARGVKTALEALTTVGTVDVARAGPDENYGFTWSVTFLTELGDVPPVILDYQVLTEGPRDQGCRFVSRKCIHGGNKLRTEKAGKAAHE